MEEILPTFEKIIIDGKTGDRVLPYLPLERSQNQTQPPPAEEQNP